MTINSLEKYEYYHKLETPIQINEENRKGFEIVGYFPYSIATIRNKHSKVPRRLFKEIEDACHKARFMDNKVVIVCRDLVDFGTDDFAIQFHDLGCRLGSLEDITGYAGSELTLKKIKDAN